MRKNQIAIARAHHHGVSIIRGAIALYDIIGTAAAPFGAYWLATRFGIGYFVLYILVVPGVSYVASVLTDRLEGISPLCRMTEGEAPGDAAPY